MNRPIKATIDSRLDGSSEDSSLLIAGSLAMSDECLLIEWLRSLLTSPRADTVITQVADQSRSDAWMLDLGLQSPRPIGRNVL